MIAETTEEEREEEAAPSVTPYLSHSRVSKYLDCPEKFRLYYIESLRPRSPAASLVFGRIVHEALAHLFQTGEDPGTFFLKAWTEVEDAALAYKERESWEKLRDCGQGLLTKFMTKELPKIREIEAVERAFRLDITSLDLPFVGVIDLLADLGGQRTVVDFKTAASSYEEHEAALSDQLTAYQLAEPASEQAALCVLVKTKEPRIEWHVTRRAADQFTEYLGKVALLAHDIASGRFYKRPGRWCSWCEYLPVCLGDRKKAEETLVQIR